jgi:hypothetical protein
VRNRGTIGGSISNNDPAADYPSAVVGLGATVVTNKREIAGDDFFTGMFETALGQDEIVTAVKFPKPQAAAYQKFKNPASRYAIVRAGYASRSPAPAPACSASRRWKRRSANPSRPMQSRTSRSRMTGSTPTSTPAPSIARISSMSWPAAPSPPAHNFAAIRL